MPDSKTTRARRPVGARQAPSARRAASPKQAAAKRSAKDKLLDAAVLVVRQKGYAATSVDDLCQVAGVTKGAFFHHFGSKEDLAVAAAQYWNDFTTEFFKSAPYQKLTDPLDRVFGYIDFRRQILQGNLEDYTCLLGTMVQEAYETSPRIRQACDEVISVHAGRVAEDIAAAKKLYAPKASFDPHELALFTQVVLQGAFVLAKAKHRPELAIASVKHLRRYFEFLFGKAH
jgi:TetR/AcrR family transcriptional regulator, transcriptional repressor for nem operon